MTDINKKLTCLIIYNSVLVALVLVVVLLKMSVDKRDLVEQINQANWDMSNQIICLLDPEQMAEECKEEIEGSDTVP